MALFNVQTGRIDEHRLAGQGPRDATRGGVLEGMNAAALLREPPEGGYGKAPLWIDSSNRAGD
jgi:hypothetical protein